MRQLQAMILLVVVAPAMVTPRTVAAETETKRWKAVKVAEFGTGLATPECALPIGAANDLYVTNIETDGEGYWEDDHRGFISRLDMEGRPKAQRWLDSSEAFPLHAPKGMCACRGKLYFADNGLLKRCDLETATNPEVVTALKGNRFNDLATDGEAVWLSDTGAGRIFYVAANGAFGEVKSPVGVNGLTCWEKRVYAVSWGLHDVYEVDPSGKDDPRPFGLAQHFTNLDGIEVLDDGTFVVSDFNGNRVSAIARDRKRVYALIELESPADIGLDRQKGLLFVPQFMKDKVSVYHLVQD